MYIVKQQTLKNLRLTNKKLKTVFNVVVPCILLSLNIQMVWKIFAIRL